MKLSVCFLMLMILSSCGRVESPEEFFDLTGDRGKTGSTGVQGESGVDGQDGADGKDGVNGVDGADGKDAQFQVIGQIGTYVDKGEDLRKFNLTCMLGDSSSGEATLRIITQSGGLVNVRIAGGINEDVYLPANRAIFIYTRTTGTFIIDNGSTSKTKACNP